MKMLRNVPIRYKLFLISIIPMLVLGYFLMEHLRDNFKQRRDSLAFADQFQQIEATSDLVHQLQIERGVTFGYLVMQKGEFMNQMQESRANTDRAIQTVRNHYLRIDRNHPIINKLDSINIQRENLHAYVNFINETKYALIKEIQHVANYSSEGSIQANINSHIRLMFAKEFLARVRSSVLASVLEKEFNDNSFALFAFHWGQYQYNIRRYRENCSPDALAFLKSKYANGDIKSIHSRIDSMFNNPSMIRTFNGDEWWSKTSEGVNVLKTVEDFSLNIVRQNVDDQLNAANRNLMVSTTVVVLIILLMVILTAIIIRQITDKIDEVRIAAERITQGEVDLVINDLDKDELGSLAKSFNTMIQVTQKYVNVADAIGKGDYSPAITIRGERDKLGNALHQMKNNLQRLAQENDEQTWLLKGNSELNDAMRGDKDLKMLADDILNCTVNYLDGKIGTLYIKQNGHLTLTSTYAFAPEHSTKHTIRVGEGLVGQAVAEGKPFILKDVPQSYLKIGTSLGEIHPKNIIIFPFRYENEVKGVIEVGSDKNFSSLDQELVEIISGNIAVTIQAAQARERLKLLLEETQGQSEELIAQQEELKIANEELQQKTEMLERSEEELRAQHEELMQTNEELYQKTTLLESQKSQLEEAKTQLEVKARELEASNQYKTEFLANMSHELRTPLNSILILSQVLIENRNGVLSPKEIQFANTIYNSGADLLELINEILDLSKIEAGKMELEIESFPLSEISLGLEDSFAELAKSKDIRFLVNVESSIFKQEITSDIQRLQQVLKNFLSNAFKFTENGGEVALHISKVKSEIPFRIQTLKKAHEIIEFSVTDTGIGIPPEKLGLIFDAFQQGDGSTKRKYGGTGLGLSISREFANLLGGEIHAQSVVGKGSTFILFLPAQYVGPGNYEEPTIRLSTQSAPKLQETLATGNIIPDDRHNMQEVDRKILILEDDEEFAKILLDLVRERNYKGIVAQDGKNGLEYARRYKPDAILLDMKLPDMDGSQILKYLKRDPELKHIPVQVISGDDHRHEILKLGAFDFIQKPMTKKDFWKVLDTIEDHVKRKIKKLLIVEDNHHHNEAVKQLIGNGDVYCFSAYSGKQAYELIRNESFDCVIVDLTLPDMNGFELLEKIKESPDISNIPLIVYTGQELSKEENARLEKLASAVVLKTAFSHERLLDETTLFLHRVESRLPKEKQKYTRSLHKADEVLRDKKVLIVDDDVRNVYSLIALFEQEGLSCIIAENGVAAIEALERDKKIDIVLMDVMMPEMDGYEATAEIRKRKEFKNLPIIALTAKAMKGDREKCLAAGMSDYISKPLNIHQLLSLMRVWLYH